MMTPADYVALPVEAGDQRVAYGDGPDRFGDLFLPAGRSAGGACAVVVLLHGGCWRQAYGLEPLGQMARRLTGLGVAVWSLEYRRIGGAGGWPATFLDAADGVQHLERLAAAHALDTGRVIVAGHSAGGHLALWLAGSRRLPPGSPVRGPIAIRPGAVVSLAGIGDLEDAHAAGICRGAPAELLDGGPGDRPERYADGSPHALLPLDVAQWHVVGEEDVLVPAEHVRGFVRRAAAAGDEVDLTVVPQAGHFEIVTAGSAAWPAVEAAFAAALRHVCDRRG